MAHIPKRGNGKTGDNPYEEVWPTDRRVVLHYSDPEGRSLFETMFKMHDITNFNPRHEVEYGY